MKFVPFEIRRIRTDEWRIFKTIRLASLQQDGDQFGQPYEEVAQITDQQWQASAARAAESSEFYVILAFDQEEAVGISGCVRLEDFGKIIMVWVEPDHRGRGMGQLLVQRAMAEAHAPLYKLTVVDGNVSATKTYERLGFIPTGFTYTNSKGIREIEMALEGKPPEQ